MPEIVVDEFEFRAKWKVADDVIGTLTRQAEAAGLPVVVASSDKDFFQLINPNVHLLNPNDKTDTLWQAEQVRAKTGVEPAQIIDWLSLVGDTVDGIPGVRGVGPKTATKLLAEYGTAKNLYANLDAVKPDGLRARLGDAAEEVRRNQELVALKEISEWQIQLDDLRPGAGDYATLHAQYTRWNFRSLLNELESGRQGELL
jgi:DNA polymerase-1